MNEKKFEKRKRFKKRKKIKKLIIANLLRAIVILIPIMTIILMVYGCLYAYERLTKHDSEEAVIQNILSMAGTKARVYDAGFQDKCTLVFHGLVIDELQQIVLREGRKVELTSTEFEIMDLLARHPGVVFGREKIEDDPAQSAYIQTVWGVGYRFCGEIE